MRRSSQRASRRGVAGLDSHGRVARVAFLVAHTLVGDPNAPKLALLLHGVLGAGNNLRSLALKITRERPDYCCCLVDLRQHGGSQGAPPPHTLAACAADLAALVEHLARPPTAVIGHSFGGKVGLLYSSKAAAEAPLPAAQVTSRQVWLLDSNPGAQQLTADHEVSRVLAAARGVPGPFVSRQEVVTALLARGLTSGLANWLATNVRADAHGAFAWIFDFDAIAALLADYAGVDLWSLLEAEHSAIEYHLVLAEKSDRWTAGERQRIRRLSELGRVQLASVPDAGHWLHVDNPTYLLSLLTTGLV